MKFNVQSKLLLSRLNAVSKVVSSNNASAILDNFLFEVQSDRLVVTGSDMETRLTTNIEIQNVEGSGKFAIDEGYTRTDRYPCSSHRRDIRRAFRL